MEESQKDKVIGLVTRNFSITKCPEKVYASFSKFCKEETNDNYSMGLKLLLDARTANIKEVVLYEQYMELKAEIADLKQALSEVSNVSESPKNKTFGSKNK